MLNPKVIRRAELAFLTSVGSVAAKRQKDKYQTLNATSQCVTAWMHTDAPPQPWECLWQIPLRSGGEWSVPAYA